MNDLEFWIECHREQRPSPPDPREYMSNSSPTVSGDELIYQMLLMIQAGSTPGKSTGAMTHYLTTMAAAHE